MPRSETVVVAFVASPGDMEPERTKLEEVIRELNLTWSRSLGMRLELLMWESSAYPGIGDDAQDVVNRQVGGDYDIFIGMMWGRFGTPTGRAGSGTEEEFNKAKGRYDKGEDLRIMFYFKDAPIAPSEMNLDDLAKIKSFKSSLGNEGILYWKFQSLEDFENPIRLHLARQMQVFSGAAPVPSETRKNQATEETARAELEETARAELEDEPGILDFIEISEARLGTTQEITERLTEAIVELGSRMASRTEEIKEASSSDDAIGRAEAKALISRAADDMDLFVTRGGAELSLFRKCLHEGIEALGKAAVLAVDLDRDGLSKVQEGREAISRLEAGINSAEKPTEEFRNTVAGLPRMTGRLNKAKRAVVAVLDDFLGGLRDGRRDAAEARKLIDSILDGAADA